jgi:lipid II:glycine glycyltransferase (peptidoglycan interpeptide bridge formation enzyme)
MDEIYDILNRYQHIERECNRLQRENERLSNLLSVAHINLRTTGKALKKAQHDNERYQSRIDALQAFIGNNYNLVPKSE